MSREENKCLLFIKLHCLLFNTLQNHILKKISITLKKKVGGRVEIRKKESIRKRGMERNRNSETIIDNKVGDTG